MAASAPELSLCPASWGRVPASRHALVLPPAGQSRGEEVAPESGCGPVPGSPRPRNPSVQSVLQKPFSLSRRRLRRLWEGSDAGTLLISVLPRAQ
uniref:Uncharacterized protein n=1 Tax=Rangifer tarandus platyrhynchus TaxID=3082113 RepID=A0ACB0EDB4_RANTA|nr:unnamed protein product [Rangifer tarandus platyrhynchus]